MMCYKDRTFCSFSQCIKKDTCDRFLTKEHIDRAEKLDMPICQFLNEPDCYEEPTDNG